ncbi:MAG: glycosyltransferase family 2 protein [Cyanobacteria bacterium J06606_4]
MKNTLVIIPVLNEADSIAGVISALRQQGLENICVVDNGSCDRTPQIAEKAGAQVVLEPRRGYGSACWRGLQTPEARVADWILFCDGDGSDDLGELPRLLALQDECDFILGNRRGTVSGRSQLSAVQNFGNWLATRLIRLGWGHRYEDLGPLRLIRRAAIDRMAMVDRGFGWTVEMQAKAAEQELKICEIPVNYLPRQGGRSKIAGTLKGSVKAGQVILTTLAVLYWQKTVGRHLVHCRHAKHFLENFLERSVVQKGLLFLSALLLVLGSLLAAPHGDFLNEPEAVPLFWRGAALMSLGFAGSWGLARVSAAWFWVVALVPRLILLAMHPGDDIWRYLWEGHIQNYGFNPYLLAPTADVLVPLRLDSWNQMNHLDHAAIYPPVAQLGFRLLAWVSPSVLLFKSAFVAADLAICGLLYRRFGAVASLLYAWNPMVMYSFAGGGHYDSWFLLPLVLAWLWWERASDGSSLGDRWPAQLGAALAVGVSIAVKWMSLPVLAFVAWRGVAWRSEPGLGRWRWLSGLLLLGVGLLPLAIAALPFCQLSTGGLHCPLVPLDSPFINYGRSAALIPQLVAKLWPASVKANWIYGLPLGLTILWGLASRLSIRQFAERYLIALMVLSPIIHAWYFTWLAPFAVASRNWGTRLVSISGFVYFALPYGLALGTERWQLVAWQRWLLWTPFVVGLLYSALILPGIASRTYFPLSDNSD